MCKAQSEPFENLLNLSLTLSKIYILFTCLAIMYFKVRVRIHKEIQQLTCIAAPACIAAWSCRRRTLYRYHREGISSHSRLRWEHWETPRTNQCRYLTKLAKPGILSRI